MASSKRTARFSPALALTSDREFSKVKSSHDETRLNEWERLKFHDPETTLRRLRNLQYRVAESNLPDDVKNLRARRYRKYLEFRQAALFAFGIGKRIGSVVYFSRHEAADHDAVCLWRSPADTLNYAPLQL